MENCLQPQREDQRVRLTKQLLQSALLQLLQEKPVQKVTVKELCQRAGVNRGTFYLHYRDVYDLMERMQEALLADLDEILSRDLDDIVPDTSHGSSEVFFTSVFAFVEKNQELCAVLLGENGDKKFVAAIIERARQKSLEEYLRRFPRVSEQDAELYYYFIAWGFIGLLQRYLKKPDGPTFREMANGAWRIITGAAGSFFGPGEPSLSL